MSGGGAALGLTLLFAAGGDGLPAGSGAVRLEAGGAFAHRIFGEGSGPARGPGARVTVAEWTGDRAGAASFARGSLALSAAWAPHRSLRLEGRLPIVMAGSWLEARDPGTAARAAIERRRSTGLGDAEIAAIGTIWRGGGRSGAEPFEESGAGPVDVVSIDVGLWISPPTGRPAALVPTADGLLEAGPLVRARLPMGRFALGVEALWRVRPSGSPDRLAARAGLAFAPAGAAWALAAGARLDLPLERGRRTSPEPALEAADSFSPDPVPVLASTAEARARVDGFAGGVARVGPVRVGGEIAAALWGRTDAAGFSVSLFAEVGFGRPAGTAGVARTPPSGLTP